jgi:hypothetical protein
VAMSDRPGFAARQGGAKTVSYARNWRRERPLCQRFIASQVI